MVIYNSRNYSILLNHSGAGMATAIYNSRNYSILLNRKRIIGGRTHIYNSRNYSILLNGFWNVVPFLSTTVEIILYYLTCRVT